MNDARVRLLAAGLVAATSGCFVHEQVGPQPIPEPRQVVPAAADDALVETREPLGVDDFGPLSPEEAALLAVEHNPELRAIRLRRGIADAQLISAGVLANPRIDTNLDAPIAGADATVVGFGVGFSWDIAPLVGRGARVQAARSSRRAVDLEVAWQEWQVAQTARLRTVRVIYLERRLALAREFEAAWSTRANALDAALVEANVTVIDVAAVQATLAGASRSRLELEQLLANEMILLAESIGVDPSQELEVDVAWSPEPRSPDTTALVDALPTRRLDLVALQHMHRSHDEGLRAATLAGFPAMEIGVHVNRDADRVGVAGVTLGFELPAFDRNQAGIAHERARRSEVEAEYDARLLLARAQVTRFAAEIVAIENTLASARDVSASSGELAQLSRVAVEVGAMNSLTGFELEQRAHDDRLRLLELEQSRAELDVALTAAAGQ